MQSPTRFVEPAASPLGVSFKAATFQAFSPSVALAAGQQVLLSSAAAERLLNDLLQKRWARLPFEYDDPLGMLFGNQAKQWTAGWSPDSNDLYVIVWETASWQEKALWRLYRNGQLVFEESDGLSKERSLLFHQLAESAQLPVVTPAQFLERLTGYHYPQAEREASALALESALLTHPFVMEAMKEPLFEALEADLQATDWPLLDILKVHRLAHKNSLIRLFRRLPKAAVLKTPADYARLNHSLQCLQAQYKHLAGLLSPMFCPALKAAYGRLEAALA